MIAGDIIISLDAWPILLHVSEDIIMAHYCNIGAHQKIIYSRHINDISYVSLCSQSQRSMNHVALKWRHLMRNREISLVTYGDGSH